MYLIEINGQSTCDLCTTATEAVLMYKYYNSTQCVVPRDAGIRPSGGGDFDSGELFNGFAICEMSYE